MPPHAPVAIHAFGVHVLWATLWTTGRPHQQSHPTRRQLSTPLVDNCGRAACRGGRSSTPRWTPCERRPTVNTPARSSTGSSTPGPHPGSPSRPAPTAVRPQVPQLLPLRRDPQNSDSAPPTTLLRPPARDQAPRLVGVH